MTFRLFILAVLCVLPVAEFASSAAAQTVETATPAQDRLPYGRSPINYFSKDIDGPLAQLSQDLESGKTRLRYQEPAGYLRSLLEVLKVPVESQVLVFSKSSLNQRLITPTNPRALYFNDDVYIGWVPDSAAIELSAVSPSKGTLYFTLPQNSETQPRLVREERCLVCHASTSALGVPGHLARSFKTDDKGGILSGFSQITHDTPPANRWGGWYVTGRHGKLTHQGNLVTPEEHQRRGDDPTYLADVMNLSPFFNVEKHLSGHSDLVALLMLDHQVHAHNLLVRLNLEQRLQGQASEKTLQETVRYLLMADAPALPNSIQGSSKYAQWYQSQGEENSPSRRLRQLDLKTRLFKFRLSPLIESQAFASLPKSIRENLLNRMTLAITGSDKDIAHHEPEERQVLLEILKSH